jgi:hypothetical protein
MAVGLPQEAESPLQLFATMRNDNGQLGSARKNVLQIADLVGRAMQGDKNGRRKRARKRVQQFGDCLNATGRSANGDNVKLMFFFWSHDFVPAAIAPNSVSHKLLRRRCQRDLAKIPENATYPRDTFYLVRLCFIAHIYFVVGIGWGAIDLNQRRVSE